MKNMQKEKERVSQIKQIWIQNKTPKMAKNMLLSRLHKIQRRNIDVRERRNTSAIEQPKKHRNNEGPKILKSVIESAMAKLNRKKESGPD